MFTADVVSIQALRYRLTNRQIFARVRAYQFNIRYRLLIEKGLVRYGTVLRVAEDVCTYTAASITLDVLVKLSG